MSKIYDFLTSNIELSRHTFLAQTNFPRQVTYIRRCAMIILRLKNLNFPKRIVKFRAIITFLHHFYVYLTPAVNRQLGGISPLVFRP